MRGSIDEFVLSAFAASRRRKVLGLDARHLKTPAAVTFLHYLVDARGVNLEPRLCWSAMSPPQIPNCIDNAGTSMLKKIALIVSINLRDYLYSRFPLKVERNKTHRRQAMHDAKRIRRG